MLAICLLETRIPGKHIACAYVRITVTLACMQPMHAGTIEPAILKWTS